jgi:Na+-transporting methylmalonyl-CoA/oxaloacetate decarboxylase gamma subunit
LAGLERGFSGSAKPLVKFVPVLGIGVVCLVIAWLAYFRRFRSQWAKRRRLIEERAGAAQ